MVTAVIGIDPGLVHTGMVQLVISPHAQVLRTYSNVIDGPDVAKAKALADASPKVDAVFVEAYTPRSHFNTDQRMVEAVTRFCHAFSCKALRNTGSKQTVKPDLMKMLGLWNFSQSTHHQDLRSAARIALFGMLKDEELNRALTDMVMSMLRGEQWNVHHL